MNNEISSDNCFIFGKGQWKRDEGSTNMKISWTEIVIKLKLSFKYYYFRVRVTFKPKNHLINIEKRNGTSKMVNFGPKISPNFFFLRFCRLGDYFWKKIISVLKNTHDFLWKQNFERHKPKLRKTRKFLQVAIYYTLQGEKSKVMLCNCNFNFVVSA